MNLWWVSVIILCVFVVANGWQDYAQSQERMDKASLVVEKSKQETERLRAIVSNMNFKNN